MTLEKSKAHQQWYKAMFLQPTILKLKLFKYAYCILLFSFAMKPDETSIL